MSFHTWSHDQLRNKQVIGQLDLHNSIPAGLSYTARTHFCFSVGWGQQCWVCRHDKRLSQDSVHTWDNSFRTKCKKTLVLIFKKIIKNSHLITDNNWKSTLADEGGFGLILHFFRNVMRKWHNKGGGAYKKPNESTSHASASEQDKNRFLICKSHFTRTKKNVYIFLNNT